MFTVIKFYMLDYITSPITVDGEEIMLDISDTAGAEWPFGTIHFDSTLYPNASVSWSFEHCIKDNTENIIIVMHR